jgi:hypothetical protein
MIWSSQGGSKYLTIILNPRVADERVPTKDELARILRYLDRRVRLW